MRQILIITLAIAALASCSKTAPVYEPAEEISIAPVNENITKSMMPEGAFLGESFNVWSWFNPASAASDIQTFQAGFSDGSTTMYVDEKPFVEKTNGKWGGKVSYFWPSVGSLVFAGYHAPALTDGTNGTTDQVTYNFSATENKMVFSNVSQGKVAADGYSEDIMYFNMTPSSYNKSSLNVSVDFKHALSWITVTLAKRVDPIIDAKITIKNVSFSKVATTGTGTVDGDADIKWVAGTDNQTVNILDEAYVIDYVTEGEGENQTYKTKVYTLDEYLFIPQDIKGLLSITYSVESTDGSVFTETYEVNLANLKDEKAQTKWEPGKHYTYNLSIGTDEITVTPTVGGWDPKSLDVLIPLPEDMYDNE